MWNDKWRSQKRLGEENGRLGSVKEFKSLSIKFYAKKECQLKERFCKKIPKARLVGWGVGWELGWRDWRLPVRDWTWDWAKVGKGMMWVEVCRKWNQGGFVVVEVPIHDCGGGGEYDRRYSVHPKHKHHRNLLRILTHQIFVNLKKNFIKTVHDSYITERWKEMSLIPSAENTPLFAPWCLMRSFTSSIFVLK